MKKYNTKTFARALITTLCFLTMRPMEGYAAVSAAASIEQNSPLLNIPQDVLIHIHEYSTPEDLKELAQTCKALWKHCTIKSPVGYAAALRQSKPIPKDIMFLLQSVYNREQQGGLINLIVQNLFPTAPPLLSLNRTMPAFLRPYVQEVSVSPEAIANFAGANNMSPETVEWALRTYDSHWTRKGEAQPCVFEDIKGYVTLAEAQRMDAEQRRGKTHLLVSNTDVNDNKNTIENILQYSSHLTVVADFGRDTAVGNGFMSGSHVKHLRLSGKNLQHVGNDFLRSCTGLTTLTLPGSLESIEHCFLWACTGLTTLTLPASLQSVGSAFLVDCTGLTNLTLPGSLESVGDGFLHRCTGLTTLTLLADLQSVGSGFLYGCRGLTTLTLPGNLQSVGDYFLNRCNSLTTLTLPASLKSIGNDCLVLCLSLTTLTLPASLKSVGDGFLNNYNSLTSLELPDSLQSVGDGFLRGCTGLTNLTLPATLKSVGDDFLEGCTSLTDLTLSRYLLDNASIKGLIDKGSLRIHWVD